MSLLSLLFTDTGICEQKIQIDSKLDNISHTISVDTSLNWVRSGNITTLYLIWEHIFLCLIITIRVLLTRSNNDKVDYFPDYIPCISYVIT